MEDRWLGPYVIVELSNTSCLLKNHSGKILKQRINLCQLNHILSQLQTVMKKSLLRQTHLQQFP